jgi:hypothetical protein
MSYQTFPTTMQFGQSITRIPHFDTRIISYGGKVRQRISMSATAWYEIVCRFENITSTYADVLMAFFEARKGAFEAFYFQNPEEAWRATPWVGNTTYATGAIVRPTTINNRSYKVVTGGISAATEPHWPTNVNGSIADNYVIWRENTYTVTFAEDTINAEYFVYELYNFGTVRLIEVSDISSDVSIADSEQSQAAGKVTFT